MAWIAKFTTTRPTVHQRPCTRRKATRPRPAARHTRIGLNSRLNCGTPKVNSPCGASRPCTVSQPHTTWAPRPQGPSVGAHAGLGQDEPRGQPRERGAQDHEHVGRAPHRDVDAVLPVPDLVEREAGDDRAQPEGPQRQRATAGTRRPPTRRPVDAVEGGDDGAEHGAAEDHHEAEEDAAVGGGDQARRPGRGRCARPRRRRSPARPRAGRRGPCRSTRRPSPGCG